MIKKLQRSLCLSAVLLLVTLGAALAQKQAVTGRVTDDAGQGMPGVNILLKGTTNGTTTDSNGAFAIEAASSDILIISFIGYKSQEIPVGDRTTFNVRLEEDLKTLEEVVVVGYGEMRRGDITAAQTSISSKDIERTVNTTIEQAIQGRAPGVYVTQNTGAPGGGISVNIRGINSINMTNEPLYVIDGVQLQGGISASGVNPLASLNPADIESMEILQGPSATAIYGSRGTNGVVLITTKRGKAGAMRISYGYTYSLQTQPKNLDVMDLRQYAQMDSEYKAIAGGNVREDFLDPSILGKGTNWQDELFKNAAMQKHQISVTGGSEATTFYLSGERMSQDGVALGSGFDRTSVRVNLDTKPAKWVAVGANLNYTQTDELLGSNNINENNLIINAIQLAPHIPVRNLDGSYAGGNLGVGAEQFSPPNPVGLAEISTNELTRRKVLGGLYLSVRPIEGLELRTNLTTDVNFSNSTYYLPTYEFGWQRNLNAFLENNHNFGSYWAWSQTIQYTKQLNRHHISAMVTHEAQESTWKNLKGTRSGFLTNTILDLNAGSSASAANGGGQGAWAMESYLGRINYNFADRYIITAAFRADGSANFGPGNKWGYFPSVSAAWRVSQENFFSGVESVSDLRLRYETGLTGNQGDGGAIYGRLSAALPTTWGSGFRPVNYPNLNYQWEETKTNNFGITLGLFDNRIQLDADYYIKNTENLSLRSELPWFMGSRGNASIGAPLVNVGSLENKGWGFSINTVNINSGGLRWESNLNISAFRTKITAFNSGANHITREGQDWFLANLAQRCEIGQAPWFFYGFIEEGLFQSRADLEASALPVDNNGNERPINEANIWVGDVKYKDVNGDGIIDANDRTMIGNPWPKWFGGFTNTFSYKGFNISILITTSYGNDVYNYVRYQNQNPNNFNLGRNMFVEAFDYAKVVNVEGGTDAYLQNPETSIPRISSSSVNGNYDRLTDKYIEDGSYVRLKNISINYTIPPSLVSRSKVLQSARIGVSAQNLATITGYSGYDPEIGSYVGPNAGVGQGFVGVDYGRYPLTPVYSVSLALEF